MKAIIASLHSLSSVWKWFVLFLTAELLENKVIDFYLINLSWVVTRNYWSCCWSDEVLQMNLKLLLPLRMCLKKEELSSLGCLFEGHWLWNDGCENNTISQRSPTFPEESSCGNRTSCAARKNKPGMGHHKKIQPSLWFLVILSISQQWTFSWWTVPTVCETLELYRR